MANARIINESKFKRVWIQPAAGDAGSAIGAAMQVWHQYYEGLSKTPTLNNIEDDMQGAYLGDEFGCEEIEAEIKTLNLPYTRLSDEALYKQTATYLTREMVVGWFQGRMEFGPRALGNRSILGDPRSESMQSQMNLKIKQRESFRPFAPAVLEEDANHWFEIKCTSPYMLQTASVHADKRIDDSTSKQANSASKGFAKLAQIRSQVPAVTHVDYSARVQTVNQTSNAKFYKLINEFKLLSGVGMLINTSFNVRGEPPVRTPSDAIRCFLATDMDVLVMGNYVLLKSEQAATAISEAKLTHFEKD